MLLGDLELMVKTAREIKAKNIVEIGCMDGTSTMALAQVAKETEGHLYCIEPRPTGKWKANIRDLDLHDYLTLIMEASPWVNMKIIPKPLDYLLIDGDHRSRWCIVDYHFWEPYVRLGGRIAFHDWTGGKAVKKWIQRAISIIFEDDSEKLKEVGRHEANDRGMIVFEKTQK